MITDEVAASTAASHIQKQRPCRPCRPLRRSSRLKRLPQLDETTPQTVEHVSASEKRSRHPRLRPSLVRSAEPSETPLSITHSRKQAKETPTLDSRKRPRKFHPPQVPEDSLWQNRDSDPIDHWRRSGFGELPKNWRYDTLLHLLPRYPVIISVILSDASRLAYLPTQLSSLLRPPYHGMNPMGQCLGSRY